jgi:hypothetical protein
MAGLEAVAVLVTVEVGMGVVVVLMEWWWCEGGRMERR